MSITEDTLRARLAVFIEETEFTGLPAAVVDQTTLCLLDFIGTAIGGSRQAPSVAAKAVFGGSALPEEATSWTDDQRVSAPVAALLNAVQGHALDMDDGHRFANGHPAVVTIPAAVALAESRSLSGRDLICAIAIGYEVFIRLGRASNPNLLERGFHTTAVVGSFAAAAVAAKLLKLNRRQTAEALSLAGLQSAGLLEALKSGETGKSLQVGKASQSGVLAALLAQQGADGPEEIFEGDKGFFKAFSGASCEAATICSGLGHDFSITEVYFKRHAACRHVHPALDGVAEIIAEQKIEPATIRSIEVETYSIAKHLTGHLASANSVLAAKFSMPVAIALLLVQGRTDAVAFTEQNIADPRVGEIAGKVTITVNEAWDSVYPAKRVARVRIKTSNHKLHEKEVSFSKGEPEFPLTVDELMAKFETNAGLVYSEEIIDRLKRTIMNAVELDAADLTSLLGSPGSHR